jgi:hypothetical protein
MTVPEIDGNDSKELGFIHSEVHPTGFDSVELLSTKDQLTVLRLGDSRQSVTTHIYLTEAGREQLENELQR